MGVEIQSAGVVPVMASLYSPSDVVPASVMSVPAITEADYAPLVGAVLESSQTYNKMVWVSQNENWDLYEQRFGSERTVQAKAEEAAGLVRARDCIMGQAAAGGIPVAVAAPASVSDAGSTAHVLAVGPEPFVSGGATYAVSTAADGSLTATRDGKPWRSFQAPSLPATAEPGTAADIAVQLLKASGKLSITA